MFSYMTFYSSFAAWVRQFFACMGYSRMYIVKPCYHRHSTKGKRVLFPILNRSCIGYDKSQPITCVDEPSKGLRIQGQVVKKPSMSDDYFWSTSTCDLENSMLQSQRSFSSISISNQSLSQLTVNHSEFVNHGVLLWNQSRLQWLEAKKTQTKGKFQEPVLSWKASYESLLGTSKRFPQPIPLCEMVDVLVDIWDQEGLYD